MELTMRPATPAERLYANTQSQQITMQTGCVGYLSGNVGEGGEAFPTTWKDRPGDEKTDEFQAELDGVVNALRLDGRYGGILRDRAAMGRYCAGHPEGGFNDGLEFAFRADTARYSYLIRLNPDRGEENMSIYCYRREWLERHMEQARKGIRFITPHYEEKFRIEDGDMVRIRCFDGALIDRVCRYIDEYHLEVGTGWDSLFHICQFAEQMERCGNTVIPLRSSLPKVCYGKVPDKRAIVMFERGFDGWRSASAVTKSRTSQKLVDELNSDLGVTKAQAAAMLSGATLGWDTPAADPKNYDADGQPIKPQV